MKAANLFLFFVQWGFEKVSFSPVLVDIFLEKMSLLDEISFSQKKIMGSDQVIGPDFLCYV